MSDDDQNTGDDKVGVGAKGLPIAIHAQYIKDLSFENPNAPETLRIGQGTPETNIGINMDARKIETEQNPDLYEVSLRITAHATREETTLFVCEVQYCAVVSLIEVPEERKHPMLLIEIPKMLFPFARQIIADLTGNGGYPPLLMNPVDFRGLYLEKFGEHVNKFKNQEKEAAEA